MPKDIVVYFKTNAKPNENQYSIENALGEVIFEKDSTVLEANMVYRDTLHLKDGNYTFKIDDKSGDGLEFWYNTKAGRGDVKLLDTLGRAIKHFNSDFGSTVQFNFQTISNAEYELDNEPSITMFPSRTPGPVTLDYFSNFPGNVEVLIVQQENEKVVVEKHEYPNFSRGTFTYDLSYLPKMRCYLKVFVDGEELFKNRIRLKE